MEKWEREIEEILEGEKVLVPVRRIQKQKEQEAEVEETITITREVPRRWLV